MSMLRMEAVPSVVRPSSMILGLQDFAAALVTLGS